MIILNLVKKTDRVPKGCVEPPQTNPGLYKTPNHKPILAVHWPTLPSEKSSTNSVQVYKFYGSLLILTLKRNITSSTPGVRPSWDINTGIAYASPLELPGWYFATAFSVLSKYSGLSDPKVIGVFHQGRMAVTDGWKAFIVKGIQDFAYSGSSVGWLQIWTSKLSL